MRERMEPRGILGKARPGLTRENVAHIGGLDLPVEAEQAGKIPARPCALQKGKKVGIPPWIVETASDADER